MYVQCYFITLITECPVKGQIKKECASLPSCHQTCGSPDPRPCPLICIQDGCECPAGTIIDETRNECVCPSECTSKYTM